MQLYSYFRSSAAYRVRIALNLKGLTAQIIPVHLLNNGGEQHSVEYQQINPQQLVPTLLEQQAQQPFILSQSFCTIAY